MCLMDIADKLYKTLKIKNSKYIFLPSNYYDDEYTISIAWVKIF